MTITAPSDFTLDATSKPYGPLAPGADAQVMFTLTNTDTTLPGAVTNDPGTTTLQKSITIATSYSTPAATASETLTLTLVPVTTIPISATAPVMDGNEDAGVYTGPPLDLSRKWSGGACNPRRDGLRHRRQPRRPDLDLRQGRGQRRQPLLLRPHPRRLPELRGHAGRVRRPLARRLRRVPDRPARQLVADELRHRHDVQARRFPVHQRPDELQRQRRQRSVLGARRRQPPGLCDWAARGDGRLAAERSGRPGRLHRDVGRQQQYDGRPRLRCGGRLQPRGQDSAGRPAVGRGPDVEPADRQRGDKHDRPAAPWPQYHAVRRGQHGRGRHDDAPAHRPEHAPRVVERHGRRPGRSVPLGPRLPARATRRLPGRPTTPTTPNVSHPNLDGVLSPQTIYQSAQDGVPISGRDPAPAEDSISVSQRRARRLRGRRSTSTQPGRERRTSSSGRATTARSRCSSRAAGSPPTRRPTSASRRARRPTAASRRGRPT